MGFQSCILAIIGAATAEQRIESRTASGQQRLVRRFPLVIRILADATVVLRHLPPFVIRLEEYIVPDAFLACAERRCDVVLRDPNATLSAMDTTQTRIGLVVCLTVPMNGLHR